MLLLPFTLAQLALEDVHLFTERTEAVPIRVSQEPDCQASVGHLWEREARDVQLTECSQELRLGSHVSQLSVLYSQK